MYKNMVVLFWSKSSVYSVSTFNWIKLSPSYLLFRICRYKLKTKNLATLEALKGPFDNKSFNSENGSRPSCVSKPYHQALLLKEMSYQLANLNNIYIGASFYRRGILHTYLEVHYHNILLSNGQVRLENSSAL